MDWHDSISPSSCFHLSPSVAPSSPPAFRSPSQSGQETDPSAVWHLYKISEPGLDYVTVYPVGPLSNQSTSLYNQTATQWTQSARLYTQMTTQPACLCAFLLLRPSVWLPICIRLFNSLSLALPASLSNCGHVWCWQALITLGLLLILKGGTVKKTCYWKIASVSFSLPFNDHSSTDKQTGNKP